MPPPPIDQNFIYATWVFHAINAICLITCIYGNVQLYRKKSEIFLQKRSLSVVFGLNASLVIAILSHMGIIYAQSKRDKDLFVYAVSGYFASWFLIWTFLNSKNFIIFFRDKRTFYTLQYKWQRIIDERFECNNFYIRNKKLCKLPFVYTIFGGIHFVMFAVAVYLMWYRIKTDGSLATKATFGIILIILFTIPFVIYITLICNIQWKLKDILYMHSESKLHAIFAIILIIGYLVANTHVTVNNGVTLEQSLIFVSVRSLAFFLMLFVSTFVIRWKNTNKTPPMEIHTSGSNSLTLDMVLGSQKPLHNFMKHLSKEYNIESCLALIEIVQYQQFIMDQIGNENGNGNGTGNKLEGVVNMEIVNFPNGTPTSTIVQINNDNESIQSEALNNVKLKAHKIYKKYIQDGSSMEINISYFMRQKLTDHFQDMDKLLQSKMSFRELLDAFEEAKDELKHLLSISLLRFMGQPEYYETLGLFDKKMAAVAK